MYIKRQRAKENIRVCSIIENELECGNSTHVLALYIQCQSVIFLLVLLYIVLLIKTLRNLDSANVS